MTSYALDSDTVSYYLRGKANVCSRLDGAVAQGDAIYIPPYVYYEIQRWLSLKNAAAQQKIFDLLYKKTGISPIDRVVFDHAVSLYVALAQKGVAVSDPDIIISAFCIKNDFLLVTNNVNHYKHIPGLRFVNWNV